MSVFLAMKRGDTQGLTVVIILLLIIIFIIIAFVSSKRILDVFF